MAAASLPRRCAAWRVEAFFLMWRPPIVATTGNYVPLQT